MGLLGVLRWSEIVIHGRQQALWGELFKPMLTIAGSKIGVFSRFVWLCVLQIKNMNRSQTRTTRVEQISKLLNPNPKQAQLTNSLKHCSQLVFSFSILSHRFLPRHVKLLKLLKHTSLTVGAHVFTVRRRRKLTSLPGSYL